MRNTHTYIYICITCIILLILRFGFSNFEDIIFSFMTLRSGLHGGKTGRAVYKLKDPIFDTGYHFHMLYVAEIGT